MSACCRHTPPNQPVPTQPAAHYIKTSTPNKETIMFSTRPMSESVPSTNLSQFRDLIKCAKNVCIITGAGISAESGIPTFRGAGGYWRAYRAQDLATLAAFKKDPSLVWELYHHRREVVFSKKPNVAHYALAEWEKKIKNEGNSLTVLTQNVDELHGQAGSENVVELHGSLFKTKCMECGKVESNFSSPICEALRDKGAPDVSQDSARIPVSELPHCKNSRCSGLLRPGVIWFDEDLDQDITEKAQTCLDTCDLCLVIGTSSVVEPACFYGPQVARRGVPVAELNLEKTPATHAFQYFFEGTCSETLSKLLGD